MKITYPKNYKNIVKYFVHKSYIYEIFTVKSMT